MRDDGLPDNLEEFDFPVSEAPSQFSRKVCQLLRGVELALGENLWEPALILIYAGIDAMAWLDRPEEDLDVRAGHFVDWVNRYMEPEKLLGCTADDLYGARCGMLHSYTGDSKRHRELKVRKLYYHRKVGETVAGLVQLFMPETLQAASVNIDGLLYSLKLGMKRFVDSVNSNDAKKQLVAKRVTASYMSEGTYLS